MDITKEFERHAAKVRQLQDFIELYTSKTELIVSLNELNDQTIHVTELLQKCKTVVSRFQDNKKQQYEQLIERAKNSQIVMLNIMEKLDEKDELERQQQQQRQQKPWKDDDSKENLPQKYNETNMFGEKRTNVLKEAGTPLRNVFVSLSKHRDGLYSLYIHIQ